MRYFVTVSVKIKNGTARDYEIVCQAFETLGLKRTASVHFKEARLPATLLAGTFMGASGSEIRDALGNACVKVFNYRSLKGEIFLAVARMAYATQGKPGL